MASNVKLLLAYEGTRYLGWQKTRMGPSIEEALQQSLERILQHKVSLQAASRTDAGVHAEGQVVNFFTDKALDFSKLRIGVNSQLPKDIVLLEAGFAETDFHPTLNAKAKEYHYTICCGPTQMPQDRLYAWHYPHALDIALMKRAAALLQGSHDFAALCNFKKNGNYAHTIRDVSKIVIEEMPNHKLKFLIKGSNFLYKMVRNIVGTLVYVGNNKIELESIPLILQSGKRSGAGVTAPAHGLTLYKVFYQKDKDHGDNEDHKDDKD